MIEITTGFWDFEALFEGETDGERCSLDSHKALRHFVAYMKVGCMVKNVAINPEYECLVNLEDRLVGGFVSISYLGNFWEIRPILALTFLVLEGDIPASEVSCDLALTAVSLKQNTIENMYYMASIV